MTPLQFAKLECAKFNHCACVLKDAPCQYFEDCVLPMVKWITKGNNAKQYIEAAKIYQAVNKAGKLI
jgi:hypothetical protein